MLHQRRVVELAIVSFFFAGCSAGRVALEWHRLRSACERAGANRVRANESSGLHAGA
jgi:hypothetical protein